MRRKFLFYYRIIITVCSSSCKSMKKVKGLESKIQFSEICEKLFEALHNRKYNACRMAKVFVVRTTHVHEKISVNIF